MKYSVVFFILFIWLTCSAVETLQDYLQTADSLDQQNQFESAIKTLENANEKYPDHADVFSRWGLIYGKMAGSTSDFMKAGSYSAKAFALLDKAVSLDQNHLQSRINRGILGSNVPAFMGKLSQAIADFEYIITNNLTAEISTLAFVHFQLATAYQKNDNPSKAEENFQKVLQYDSESEIAESARQQLSQLSEEQTGTDQEQLDDYSSEADLKDVDQLMANSDYEQAAIILRKLISADPENLQILLMHLQVLGNLAGDGYNEKIYQDPEYRTNLAFEIADILDKAHRIAPDNMEIRFIRDELLIELPFFVGRMDEGIDDLLWISENKPQHQAKALFLLGKAYRKKATSHWVKAYTETSDPEMKELILKTQQPKIKYFNPSETELPCFIVDFTLGLQDELEPQLAIWIETAEGKFVKTIYVSGFSGFVKEKQVTLPSWAKSSRFQDADLVTGASIDIGHHLYQWDLQDYANKTVTAGEYKLFFEICHWPHVNYEYFAIPFILNSENFEIINSDNELIPQIRLRYYQDLSR